MGSNKTLFVKLGQQAESGCSLPAAVQDNNKSTLFILIPKEEGKCVALELTSKKRISRRGTYVGHNKEGSEGFCSLE